MEKDILILVIGPPGAGKSSFINRLLSAIGRKQEAVVNHSLSTHPTKPIVIEDEDWLKSYVNITVGGMRVVVVESGDLERYYPTTSTDFPVLLACIFYLQSLGQDRPALGMINVIRQLGELRKSFPIPVPWSSVVFLTTHGRETCVRAGERAEIIESEIWRKLLRSDSEEGAKTLDFKDDSEGNEVGRDALAIVENSLKRVDVWLGKETSETLGGVYSLVRGMRITGLPLKEALHKALTVHRQTLAAGDRLEKGEELSDEERRGLEREWNNSIDFIEGLMDQFSTWDKILFPLNFRSLRRRGAYRRDARSNVGFWGCLGW